MTTELICTIINGIVAVIVTLVGVNIKKSNKEQERRADRRQQESLLSLELASATLELSIVSANALTGGKNNGNVERAREKAKKAEESYRAFEHKLLAEELNA